MFARFIRVCAAGFVVLGISTISRADRIDDLEKQVKALTAEVTALKTQIAQLGSQSPATPPAEARPTSKPTLAAVPGKRWIVKVVSNEAPDTARISSQLQELSDNLVSQD